MAVVPRKLKSRTVYYVTHRVEGAQRWEHVGTDKREAARRDVSMKREITAGTYMLKASGELTVGAFAKAWFAKRRNRTADDDRDRWDNHVAGRCPWFLSLRLDDVRTLHVLRLLEELRAPYKALQNGREGMVTLSEKSIFNILAVVKTLFRDARIAEAMIRNVCELPKDHAPNPKPTKRRRPYEANDVRALTTDDRIRPDARMWLMLAFYTGMREGEICGRRFRNWDRSPEPLSSLLCDTQYDDRPLKTEEKTDENPRLIPVHPALEEALRNWWETGYEMVFCRKPTADDFIVPCRARKLRNHTKSSAYKMFRKACVAAEVTAQSLHAARHTFISFARRGGARKDVLEKVTHNAAGEIIDVYTTWDWAPLCDAVSCFMAGHHERPRPDLRVVALHEPPEHAGAAKTQKLSNPA